LASPWLKDIPKAKEILDEILAKPEWKNLEKRIKSGQLSVSTAFVRLESQCYKRYLSYEKKVRKKWIHKNAGKVSDSLSQSRASRGGSTTERILALLLTYSGIPVEKGVRYPRRKSGESLDMAIPSKRQLRARPGKTVVISVKRRVRERWREVVGEAYLMRKVHNYKGKILFVTMEADLSAYAMRSMKKLGVRLYTPPKHAKKYKRYGVRSAAKLVGDLNRWMKKKEIVSEP
jgi:hypothetical protein